MRLTLRFLAVMALAACGSLRSARSPSTTGNRAAEDVVRQYLEAMRSGNWTGGGR